MSSDAGSTHPTERLYFSDSYKCEFEARVLEARPVGDHIAVVLDRTAFYPTSGGQPNDLGTLNEIAVVDVTETDEVIVHCVRSPVAGAVVGRIDWGRRFDHMQQHTGQHILSQAFLRICRAQTRSVHFGIEASTLDLEVADLTAQILTQVEDLANEIIVADRPVHVRQVDESALDDLGLRRPAKRHGQIRVVDVEGFDRSACGGTHVQRTGEVGPIKVRRWERAKGGVRAEFLCGWRALRDYREKSALVGELGLRFTVSEHDVGEAVGRLVDQLTDTRRVLAAYRDQALALEAAGRVRAAGAGQLIAEVIADRPVADVIELAGRILAAGCPIVLLGTSEGKVIFARSPALSVDLRALLRRITAAVGGRGGGRPDFVQGAVPPARIAETIERAASEARQLVPSRGTPRG